MFRKVTAGLKQQFWIRSLDTLVVCLLFLLFSSSAFAVTTSEENGKLTVTLVNAYTQEGLVDRRINAYRVRGDDIEWVKGSKTGANGVANFDLPGLGHGAIYRLRALAYSRTGTFSENITKPGTKTLEAGKLEIQVIQGANDSPVADLPVVILRAAPGGRREHLGRGQTDASGIVRFDTRTIINENEILAVALSPLDEGIETSGSMSSIGKYKFIIGAEAKTQVTLQHALSGDPVAGGQVASFELLPDGEKRWDGFQITDNAGVAHFELAGIDSGRKYIFRTATFYGGIAFSKVLTNSDDVVFEVGNVPLYLIDGKHNKPLHGRYVAAFKKLSDGELEKVSAAYTNRRGTVYFTLHFEEGQQYVFRVRDPFGSGKYIYSDVVVEQGPFEFVVLRDGDHDLDNVQPEIIIQSPQDGDQVLAEGFRIEGLAADNHAIKSVTVSIHSPGNGQFLLLADYNPEDHAWGVDVPSVLVAAGETIGITATAMDKAMNESHVEIHVQVAGDTEDPVVVIASHVSGDNVPDAGFLLFGTATDDTGISSLQITLDDSALGRTIDQTIPVAQGTGDWSLLVTSAQISVGETASIQLAATDTAGKQSSVGISLNVVAADVTVRHLINRITFGATPDLINTANSMGANAFLQQQLDPDNIDDALFQDGISVFEPLSLRDLEQYALLHMIHSQRQLREVMTWFWDNHFNTDIRTKRGEFENTVAYELAENRDFRSNALGNFRDLLEISAKSPSMLIYLDSVRNVKADANENYIRELLELHTMRVDGGFTHHEIHGGAEMFTGWTVQNDAFFFNATEHNTDPHTFLGVDIPAGGVEQGEQILDILATHLSTARFICEKLGQVFVNDTPPESLIGNCAAVFLVASNDTDQISQVLEFILTSPEFSTNHRSKIKSPVEIVVGTMRNLGILTNARDLSTPLVPMGMRLFRNSVPTGWSETGDDWMNSNLLLSRIAWINNVVSRHRVVTAEHEYPTAVDVLAYFQGRGLETAQGIVGYLLQVIVEDDFTTLEYTTALDVLNEDEPFDINAEGAEYKLRQLLGTVMSYPAYQFQ